MFQVKTNAAIDSKNHDHLTTALRSLRSYRNVKICHLKYFKFQISDFRLDIFEEEFWESEVGKKSDFPTFRLCYITGLFSFLFLTTLQVSQEYAASRILALHIDIEPSNIQLPPQNASPSV